MKLLWDNTFECLPPRNFKKENIKYYKARFIEVGFPFLGIRSRCKDFMGNLNPFEKYTYISM